MLNENIKVLKFMDHYVYIMMGLLSPAEVNVTSNVYENENTIR